VGYIYRITNVGLGKTYVGQTDAADVQRRWDQHIREADKRFPDSNISLGIKQHGIDNFSFDILEECDTSMLDERERIWIHYYNSYLRGYNQTRGNGFPVGYNHLKAKKGDIPSPFD